MFQQRLLKTYRCFVQVYILKLIQFLPFFRVPVQVINKGLKTLQKLLTIGLKTHVQQFVNTSIVNNLGSFQQSFQQRFGLIVNNFFSCLHYASRLLCVFNNYQKQPESKIQLIQQQPEVACNAKFQQSFESFQQDNKNQRISLYIESTDSRITFGKEFLCA